ncbi:histone-like nucleoid-structuring protein Lsr2 [Gordonia sp. CPCC 206044]|uniref:Lsr2 dimerization domain-containing protein n=1 Tax=Gordonia sp. CPCC 206044 TaxID=3140793 RepID=UPI003AF3D12E
MTTVKRVHYIDDVDGKPVDPDDLHTIELEISYPHRPPARYRIDLRTANFDRFERDLAAYADAAHRMPVHGHPRVAHRNPSLDGRVIRAWATARGYPISTRGRISMAVLAAYDDAHRQ